MKTELLNRLVLPVFGQRIAMNPDRAADIGNRFKLQNATKYQELEMPGLAAEGRLWVTVHSMAHSYCYHHEKRSKCGTQIWRRGQFIFCPSSLLEGEVRNNYVAILEPSVILSISYPDLLDLMGRYHNVDVTIRALALKQEHYHRHRNLLLNQRPIERVKQLRVENPAFIHCTTQEVQAMHVNMSLRSYIDQVNKLKL
jgi:hypothetical protein